GFEKAIEYFNQAIAIDPNYALAYSGLADCHIAMTTYGISPPAVGFSRAKDAVKSALAIDDALAEAHASLAHLSWLHEWDWDGAEIEFKRAISLNPNYATAHQWYSIYLSAMARHKEAIAEIISAQQLDPLSIIIGADAARVFYHAGQYEQAVEQCLKMLEIDPGNHKINDWLTQVYERQGLYDKAVEAQLKVKAALGATPETIAMLKAAYLAAGWKGYWRKQLELAQEWTKKASVSPYNRARIHARLGERDKALEWLQQAYDIHSDQLVLLKVDPLLDPLRSDARFQDLLRRVGFSQ